MKKFLLYIVLVVIVAFLVMLIRDKGYKVGYKAGLTQGILSKKLEEWKEKNPNKFPIDPNKPTIKMMSVNFGYDVPPELAEVGIIHEVIREKYNIEYVDKDPDVFLSGPLATYQAPEDPKIIKLFYTYEVYLDNNPQKFLDTYDLVMGFDFIDRPNYLRVPYVYAYLGNKIRHDYDRHMKCNPKKEHFACFLVSNSGEDVAGKFAGAKARNRMFHRLSLYKKVLSGGKYLNNVGGPVQDGEKFLSQCKFTISYENTLDYPGYVTEKPFNAWLAGTVPIYNTDSAGLVDINKKSVIFAGDFNTEEDLVNYIIKVDNDDKLYCDIWNERIIDTQNKDYEVVKAQLRTKLNNIFEQKLKK
jgi:alpha(1,3/1,4) fucosyltransferase